MDYFEKIIQTLLEKDGYWVRQSFKVELSKEEKKQIGKPSMPRPEIDLIAYKQESNELFAIEVKSYLDSRGVYYSDLQQTFSIPTGRYKLFTCANYRDVVFKRLRLDLMALGMVNSETEITLGLAAGKVYQNQTNQIQTYFESQDWLFWSPELIRKKFAYLAKIGYENEPAVISAKLLSEKHI